MEFQSSSATICFLPLYYAFCSSSKKVKRWISHVVEVKLDSYSKAKHFSIIFSYAHFRFWGHERLSDRSISKRYPKSDASELKQIQLQEHLHSWHMILLVIWKCAAWTFYRRAVALSLNGNAAAHHSVVKKTLSVQIWIQLTAERCFVTAMVIWTSSQSMNSACQSGLFGSSTIMAIAVIILHDSLYSNSLFYLHQSTKTDSHFDTF